MVVRSKADTLAETLRNRAVDVPNQRILVTDFRGSQQEEDLTEPANCGGLGRIRHFQRNTSTGWPRNPLPIEPAARGLRRPAESEMRAQVFQNAACNWRCWYCFVDFKLLAANPRHAQWVTAGTLVESYLSEPNRPAVIDLTGGQPDLVPEWVPWMMRELRERGLEHKVYLWSDDNLSNDYFWRFLTDADMELVATYPMYGKVGCFKGFNASSFAFNTRTEPELFDRQFELMGRALALGIDQYAYATFTTPNRRNIPYEMARFVERLQMLDVNLPLRTVPLEIRVFTPGKGRRVAGAEDAMVNQRFAVEAWQYEMARRYSESERSATIVQIPLASRQGLGLLP